MTKAVIWDMDGVIVDTKALHWQSWQELFNETGGEYSHEDFIKTFGVRAEEIIKKYVKGIKSEQKAEELAEKKEELFREIAKGKIQPLPGSVELIKALKSEDWQLAIGSSTMRANVEMVLNELDVLDCFTAIVSAEDVDKGKPDPGMFLLAAERVGAQPDRAVVIEDSVPGVEAAKGAGMKCVGVTNTRSSADLKDADIVVQSLEELTPKDFERLVRSK